LTLDAGVLINLEAAADTTVKIQGGVETLTYTGASAGNAGGHLELVQDDGATTASGHRLGAISFMGAHNASNATTVGARIDAFTTENWSADNNDAYMAFYTDGANNLGERMRIQSNGMIELNSAGGAIDHGFIFDGNAEDYHIGLEDASDSLVIGVDSTLGTNVAIEIDGNAHVGIGGAPDSQENLRIYPNTAPTTGSGTIFPVLQTTGGSVTVTGQSGAVYNHRFGSSTLTAGSSTTVPTYATVYIPSAATAGSNTTIDANYALFVDAGVSRFDGDVGIGTTSPHGGHANADGANLDIQGNFPLVLGSDESAATRTNNTIKNARIGLAPYDNTEEPTSLIWGESQNNYSHVSIGGGSSWMNAVEEIKFYTFTNPDQPSGTLRAKITDAGDLSLENNDLLNVGASGNDWTTNNLAVATTNAGGGA